MSATLEQVQTTTPATKALWAAVGVLGVAAVAMGAAGLSLLSEVPVRVLPDVLVTVNQQPLRTP